MKRVTSLAIASEYNVALLPTAALIASENVGDVNIIDLDTNTDAAITAAAGSLRRAAFITLCENSDGVRYLEYSTPIHLGEITDVNGGAASPNDFAAAAAKVMTIDVTGIAVPVAGNVYEIFLTDLNDYNYIIGRRRVTYEAVTGDTSTEVALGLIDAINEDVSIPNVLAATTGAGTFTLTGIAVPGSGQVINNFRFAHEILFDVVLGENMFGAATAVVTVDPDKGCGTVAEVLRMEEVYKGYKGFTNRVIFPSSSNIQYKAPTMTATGYDLFVIENNQPQHTNTEGSVPALVVTTVAIDEAAANIAAFVTAYDVVTIALR